MQYLPDPGYRRILVLSFYIIAGVAAFYIVFKYLLGFVLPFVIAWIVALTVQPLIHVISRKTHIPGKLLSFVFVVALLALIGFGLFALLDRLYVEAVGLIGTISENADSVMDSVFDFIDNIAAKIPLVDGIDNSDYLYSTASDLLQNTLSALSSKLPEFVGGIMAVLPNFLFFTVILVMASFYICADFNDINTSIAAQMPDTAINKARQIKEKLVETGFKYLQAYLLMILFTFVQLLIGFLILGFDYAFTIALITAVVDVLPVIGVGTVLIPWSGVLLLRGMYYEGFGLLILFAAVSVVRQIIEPRVVGLTCGLPPLVMIISMYAGFKAFGLLGMFLMPIMFILLKNLNDGGIIRIWKPRRKI